MLKCPFCESPLQTQTQEGWLCACGENVPFGYETDSEESCETCPVLYCPRRKKPRPTELHELKMQAYCPGEKTG